MDIKGTLEGMAENMDASVLVQIKELCSGDKVAQAVALAEGMDELALECVSKAVTMVERMQGAVDGLPQPVKDAMQDYGDDGEETPELTNIEPDIAELMACIEAIQQLNLLTAMESGMAAFHGLSAKAEVCTVLFNTVHGFAQSVAATTEAITNLDVAAIAELPKLAKDMCKCINMSELIRQFAEEAGKLIQVILQLFRETSAKMSTLFAALDYAKDCLSDCAVQALEANDICQHAYSQGCELAERSNSIRAQIEGLGELNLDNIQTMKELCGGDEIHAAIELANSMDGLITQCTDKVVGMLGRVQEGYDNLPPILTEGVGDLTEAGTSEEDPAPANTEGDIEEINNCTEAINTSNVFSGIEAGTTGFSNTAAKAETCCAMLQTSQGFAMNTCGTVEVFMGSWDLEMMANKITEICRCVKLGSMMQQFAEQTKALVLAIVALLQAAVEKFSHLEASDLAAAAGQAAQDAIGDVAEQFGFTPPAIPSFGW